MKSVPWFQTQNRTVVKHVAWAEEAALALSCQNRDEGIHSSKHQRPTLGMHEKRSSCVHKGETGSWNMGLIPGTCGGIWSPDTHRNDCSLGILRGDLSHVEVTDS